MRHSKHHGINFFSEQRFVLVVFHCVWGWKCASAINSWMSSNVDKTRLSQTAWSQKAARRGGDVSDEEGFLRRLPAAAELEISRDKTGGAARLLLTDNNHMLPSLITLILSVQGQEHSPEQHPHTHSQVNSTQCLWQLILYMLFSWKRCPLGFSATVMKAVGFRGWLGFRKQWIKTLHKWLMTLMYHIFMPKHLKFSFAYRI